MDVLRARLSHGFLGLAVWLLAGRLACANRGMQAPAVDS